MCIDKVLQRKSAEKLSTLVPLIVAYILALTTSAVTFIAPPLILGVGVGEYLVIVWGALMALGGGVALISCLRGCWDYERLGIGLLIVGSFDLLLILIWEQISVGPEMQDYAYILYVAFVIALMIHRIVFTWGIAKDPYRNVKIN